MPPLIRALRHGELALAAEFPASEGWTSETREIFEGFLDYDPNGFLAAEEDGRPVGICAATLYGAYGFIGELIVLRQARGRGLGPALLDAAIGYLKSQGAENIYLDGVRKAVPFYEHSGFRPVCRSLRFSGWAGEVARIDARDENGALRPMAEDDLSAVCALDIRAFGADRSFFLKRRLALHLLARAAGRRCRVGVLETNAAAVRFFRSLRGLAEFPPSIRMVLGDSGRLGNSPMCLAVGSPAKG